MTAGSGVIHSEMPIDGDPTRGRSRQHGFQLWVNLPATDKMIDAALPGVPADEIPEVHATTASMVRVIAGKVDGTDGSGGDAHARRPTCT